MTLTLIVELVAFAFILGLVVVALLDKTVERVVSGASFRKGCK